MPPGMGRHTAPLDFPEAPTFRPSWDEFKDFVKYVEYLETTDAPKAGICKIVAPPEWVPRKSGYEIKDLNYTINGPIKQYFNQIGMKGAYQAKGIVKPAMSVQDYHKMVHEHTYRTPAHSSYDDLERKYWKSLAFVQPIYGCDVAANLSDPGLKEWNIASLGSILDTIKEDPEIDIKGVLSPYIYFGMWKATFSWHVEDMDLYAINAIHYGMPKTWYCVPPKYGHLLEKAAREIFPNVASWCSNFMRHKTCLIAPDILERYGVPFQKIVQEERNIIITWPYAYHSGFNHGFNIAESTNFAMPRWIEYGKRCRPCDCSRSRVTFSMDPFVKKFQPEKFDDWISGRDIAPHPEDPPEVAKEIMLRAENPEAYKAMMEKRMRVNVEKKRHTRKVDNVDNDDMIDVDIYQHPEQKNIVVSVNPATMKCRGYGLQFLRERLNDSKLELKDLIDRGLLIKIDSRKVHRGKRPLAEVEEERMVDPELANVTVYRHVDNNIQAIVDPNTFDLVGDQDPEVFQFLEKSGMPMKVLIQMNVFVKVVDAKIKIKETPYDEQRQPHAKRARLHVVTGVGGQERKISLHVYKSVQSDDISIKVHPKTMQPFYKLKQRTKYFLRGRTIEEAVRLGVLAFNGEIQVTIRSPTNPEAVVDSEPKVVKAIETVDNLGSVCDVYRTTSAPIYFSVSRKTLKVIGRKSDELITIIGDRSVPDLVQAGVVVCVGQKKVGQRGSFGKSNAKFDGVLFSEVSLINNRKIVVASDGKRVAFLCSQCSHPEESGLYMNGILQSTKDLNVTKANPLPNTDARKTVLFAALTNVFVDGCPNHDEENSDLKCYCSVSGLERLHREAQRTFVGSLLTGSNDSRSVCLQDETAKEIIFISNDVLNKDDLLQLTTTKEMNCDDVIEDEIFFVDEEDPDESESKPIDVASNPEFDDSESDVDDLLYTTESSSESNESSDDPNYGTGRHDGLWNRRSTRSKKKRKKLLKKMKLISREEYFAQRAVLAEERERRRQRKTEKRSRAVDSFSVVDLTRSIVSYLTNKSDLTAENSACEFSTTELKEKFNEDRSNIVSVLRIFAGLGIVKKDNEESDEDVFFWVGVDKENIYSVLLEILNGGRLEGESSVWLVFRDFIKSLLINRYGARVFPKVLGKCHYGVNETRRVTLSAAILEGLNLVESKNDALGGVLWTGKDLFRVWDEQQREKFTEPELQLRDCRVVVDVLEGITHEDIDAALTIAEQIVSSSIESQPISTENLTSEQQRSVVNQNVVCRCGKTKKLEHEVQRDGKTHNRSKVYVGGKRRMRCKTCDGCKAPKCNQCQFCLKPHLKKPCVQRVCLFPVVPKCPCFA